MPATFNARKTTGPDGAVMFDLTRDGVFFATLHIGHKDEWCFTDLNDERRGYRVRSKLTRRLGRDKTVPGILPIIREEYREG